MLSRWPERVDSYPLHKVARDQTAEIPREPSQDFPSKSRTRIRAPDFEAASIVSTEEMVDLHSHAPPDVDNGARALEESLEVLVHLGCDFHLNYEKLSERSAIS